MVNKEASYKPLVAEKEVDNHDRKLKEVITILKFISRLSQPFPQRLKKKVKEKKYQNFVSILKELSINIPLVEDLELM